MTLNIYKVSGVIKGVIKFARAREGGLPARASPAGGLKILMVFFGKKGSNFFVITAQFQKFRFFGDNSPRIFPQPTHFLPREAEVHRPSNNSIAS